MKRGARAGAEAAIEAYRLDEQVGFLLRRAHQRHTAIFARSIADGLTPTQFAALARLYQLGDCSQNRLGRLIAVDAATIKGVVERLHLRGLVELLPDPSDKRRITVSLTEAGRDQARRCIAAAIAITQETLAPLDAHERRQLAELLCKIG